MAKLTNWTRRASSDMTANYTAEIRLYQDNAANDDTRAKRIRIQVIGYRIGDDGTTVGEGVWYRMQATAQAGDGLADGTSPGSPKPLTATVAECDAISAALTALIRNWRLDANNDIE